MNQAIGASLAYNNPPGTPASESLQSIANETASQLAASHGMLDQIFGGASLAEKPSGSVALDGAMNAAFNARSLAISLHERLMQLRDLTGTVGG